MKKTIMLTVISLLNAILLVSCVSPAVKSHRIDPEEPNPQVTARSSQATNTVKVMPVKGVAYCLPMVQFRLTAILTNMPDPNIPPTNVFVAAVSNSYTSTTFINQTNPNAAYIVSNQTLQVFSNSVLMPKVNTNATKQVYLVTIDPIICQDPNFLYALKMTENKVSSDTFGLFVDPTNNFLQSVNATNADQTSQIIESLAKAAATVFTMGAGAPFGGGIPFKAFTEKRGDHQKLRTPPPGRVEVIFDPTSPEDMAKANYSLMKLFVEQEKGSDTKAAEDITPIQLKSAFRGNPVSGTTTNYLATHRPENAKGVLYRPMLPYVLEIYNAKGEMGINSIQYLIRSPNAAPVFSLPVNRATFVTRTTSITFNNGFLQGVNYSNPSQLAAVLGLPLTVVGDVFSSVTNVLQLRLNIATAQGAIATQETALVNQTTALNNATTNLLESIKRLDAYRNSSTNKP